MLIEPDRAKRNRLFECAAKPLEAFVAPNHLLRRIDECIDFRAIAAPLGFAYDPDQGRPAVPPEVLVRAFVIGYAYGIPSFRKLCAAIEENLAFRWFLFLGLEDEVFDPSTITVFLRRLGSPAFRGLLARLNHDLSQAGLLTDCAYADSSLVPAAVARPAPSPTTLTPEAFADAAIKENGIFVTREVEDGGGKDKNGVARRRLVRRYFQDAKGRLALHPKDLDARWRTHGSRSVFGYKQHVIVDDHGFILAQRVTHSSDGDADPWPAMLDETPLMVRILTADTGYSAGQLRRELARRGIEAHIPLHPNHRDNRKKREGFRLKDPRELVCPAGRVLKRTTHYPKENTWLYAAKQRDCQPCLLRSGCLPAKSKRRFILLSTFEPESDRACRLNATPKHRRLMRSRKTIVEGVFAHLDGMGFRRARRRGLERVQVEGLLVAFAYNILKATKQMLGPQAGAARIGLLEERPWGASGRTLPAPTG